jgi:hypothetical protein
MRITSFRLHRSRHDNHGHKQVTRGDRRRQLNMTREERHSWTKAIVWCKWLETNLGGSSKKKNTTKIRCLKTTFVRKGKQLYELVVQRFRSEKTPVQPSERRLVPYVMLAHMWYIITNNNQVLDIFREARTLDTARKCAGHLANFWWCKRTWDTSSSCEKK